jgi:hypothetical protein
MAPAPGHRRVHELADRGEHGCDGLIVRGELLLDAGFELIEAFGSSLFELKSSRSRTKARTT